MTVLDHLFTFLIAVAYPVASFIGYRRLLKRVAAGAAVNRPQLYRNTVLSHWTLFVVCLALWAFAGRAWPQLGFSFEPDLYFALASVVTVAGIAGLLLQIRQIRSATQDEIDKVKSQLGSVSMLIPHSRGELGRFYCLSVTAGIVEETIWRGYLIWYFSQFMPLMAAALVSTVGFGLGHAYQGIKQLPKVTLVGAAFAVLTVLSGSIWLPMILHAAVDILQGRLAYDVVNRDDSGSAPAVGDIAGASAS